MARSYERINWNYVSRDCPMYSCELIYWISCCAHSAAFKFNITVERSLALSSTSIFRSITRPTDEKAPSDTFLLVKKKKVEQHLCNSSETGHIQVQLFVFDTKLKVAIMIIKDEWKTIPFSSGFIGRIRNALYLMRTRNMSRTASQELNA